MIWNLLKKGFITAGVVITTIVSMPIAATIFMKAMAMDEIYESVGDLPQKEAVLVLGAATYPTGLSPILQDRMDTGLAVFEAGKADEVVVSGSEKEAVRMSAYALEKGVEPDKLVGDGLGYNTLASIKNAADHYDELVIVTQEYHLPRALFMARHYGLDAVGLTADKREYERMDDFLKREVLASAYWFYKLKLAN